MTGRAWQLPGDFPRQQFPYIFFDKNNGFLVRQPLSLCSCLTGDSYTMSSRLYFSPLSRIQGNVKVLLRRGHNGIFAHQAFCTKTLLKLVSSKWPRDSFAVWYYAVMVGVSALMAVCGKLCRNPKVRSG